MKKVSILLLAVVFFGCQKQVSTSNELKDVAAVSSDAAAATAALPCHSTAFTSNYPIVAGQVPPFRFTKTLYADTRVKTINMLSRVYPIYGTYKKWVYELIGTFTYSPNAANFIGTRQTWEYYKTTTGAAAKRSIAKKNVSYKVKFTTRGFCSSIEENGVQLLAIDFLDPSKPNAVTNIYVDGPTGIALYYAKNDGYGNTLSYDFPYNNWESTVSYTYDYSIPRASKNYSFIPTQNLISPEYNLCEVMQWLPQSTHQRKNVTGEFYYGTNHQKVLQTQVYKNYKFDAKGNEISLTYADNVLQKTSWFCK